MLYKIYLSILKNINKSIKNKTLIHLNQTKQSSKSKTPNTLPEFIERQIAIDPNARNCGRLSHLRFYFPIFRRSLKRGDFPGKPARAESPARDSERRFSCRESFDFSDRDNYYIALRARILLLCSRGLKSTMVCADVLRQSGWKRFPRKNG